MKLKSIVSINSKIQEIKTVQTKVDFWTLTIAISFFPDTETNLDIRSLILILTKKDTTLPNLFNVK